MASDIETDLTKVVGLILARKNSKGISNKNTALLDGVPMVVSAIRTMYRSHCFESIWVSTDCDDVRKLARKEGAYVHKRASYTATDEASSVLAVQEFLQHHDEIKNICLVQCTSPFLRELYLQKGLNLFLDYDWDSVFSVTRRHSLRWSQDVPSMPLNFDPKNRPRRQTFIGDLCENGMFYFARKEFIREGTLQGGRCCYVEIPEEESMDIDSPLDLFLAQQILVFRRNPKFYSNESAQEDMKF